MEKNYYRHKVLLVLELSAFIEMGWPVAGGLVQIFNLITGWRSGKQIGNRVKPHLINYNKALEASNLND